MSGSGVVLTISTFAFLGLRFLKQQQVAPVATEKHQQPPMQISTSDKNAKTPNTDPTIAPVGSLITSTSLVIIVTVGSTF